MKIIRVFQDWLDRNDVAFYSAMLIEKNNEFENVLDFLPGTGHLSAQEASRAATLHWKVIYSLWP